jgi:hypothetical protein
MPTKPLARPAFAIEPDDFIKKLGWDAALPDTNACPPQMLCDGCSMQVPARGELQHAVTGLVLDNELLGILW